MYRLWLISNQQIISNDHIQQLPTPDSWQWVDKNKAGYCLIDHALNINEIEKYRTAMEQQKIDVFCVPNDTPQYRLFIADMDSTIVTGETLDELASFAGIEKKIIAITERAMRGELDFHEALHERVRLLKGLNAEALDQTLHTTKLSDGSDTLMQSLQQKEIKTALVSGGFTFFTSAIAEQLGFDHHHGNQLEIENNHLTGRVIDPILDRHSKLAYLKQYADHYQCDLSQTIAIGDGANDLDMLRAAGLGIGYHPKPLVREQIVNCIIHGNLSTLTYLL